MHLQFRAGAGTRRVLVRQAGHPVTQPAPDRVTGPVPLAPAPLGARRAWARALWGAFAAEWTWRHTGAAVALTPALTFAYDWLSRPAGLAHGHGPVALLPVGALAALLLAGSLPTGPRDAAPGRRSERRSGPPCSARAWVFAVLALFPLASGGPGSIAMAMALLVMGLSQRLLGQLFCRI